MKVHSLSERLLILSGVLFAGFAAGTISFSLIGQKIDQDGVLREPFPLIPLSALCLFGSSISLVGAGAAYWKNRC